MSLRGAWFSGAASNVTAWAELAEISHESTCTSDTTTCKYMCALKQFNKNSNPKTNVKTIDFLMKFWTFFQFLKRLNDFYIITKFFHVLPLFLPMVNVEKFKII